MAALATADICDANAALLGSGELRILQPIFQIYGQTQAFSGQVITVKVFDGNAIVHETLSTKGHGGVLVIDGEGAMRCALMGGNLAKLALDGGWSGVVVNGCVRDVDEINGYDIGVRALGSHPKKPGKKRVGEKKSVPVYVGGTWILEGEWLYADSDGILVSKTRLSV